MDPRFTIQGGCTTKDATWVLLMRGRAQFDISVTHEKIEGTDFGDRYLAVVIEFEARELEDPLSCLKPLNFVGEYCLPVLEELAPDSGVEGLTMDDFFSSPCWKLEILRTGNSREVEIAGRDSFELKPVLNLAPLKMTDLPKSIPRFPANQVFVNADKHESIATLQGKVTTSSGESFYLKPRESAREKQFDRELDILQRIQELDIAKNQIKLSQLQGMVVAGSNNEFCIGVLINMITSASFGSDLLSPGCWVQRHLHTQWERQVRSSVEKLHENGLVWGDVNAGNVFIDQEEDACVIDFGGMNNPEFVDDDLAETIEGDWQGVGRLFREWLPKRRAEGGN